MLKIQIKYKNETEKYDFINSIKKDYKILSVSKPKRSGEYFRGYIDVEGR